MRVVEAGGAGAEMLRAVVPSVSVNDEPFVEITFPFVSVIEPEPDWLSKGACMVLPDLSYTTALGAAVTEIEYPEPSVAVAEPEYGGPVPQGMDEVHVETVTLKLWKPPKGSK